MERTSQSCEEHCFDYEGTVCGGPPFTDYLLCAKHWDHQMAKTGSLPTRTLWSREKAAWQLPRNPNRILDGCSRSICWLNPGQLFCTNQSLLSPWLPEGSNIWGAATEQGSLTLLSHQVLFKGVPAPFKSMPSATSFFPQIIKCLHLTTGGSPLESSRPARR